MEKEDDEELKDSKMEMKRKTKRRNLITGERSEVLTVPKIEENSTSSRQRNVNVIQNGRISKIEVNGIKTRERNLNISWIWIEIFDNFYSSK